MSAYLSVHDVKRLRASTVYEPNNGVPPHISLDFVGEEFASRAGVTLYIKDQVLNDRLIEAINDIVERRTAELAAASIVEAV